MDRAVLITGCSTGIGCACALRLARQGWRVHAGVRKQADADRLAGEGLPDLRPVILDVTDGASIGAAVSRVREVEGKGGLAGLVNNAGIVVPGPLELLASEDLRRQLEVNLVGLLAVTRAFLPMLRLAGGRIVNMSSVSGHVAYPFLGAYSASKFALEAASDALRVELRPGGIRVVLVEPGPVRTPIWDKGKAAYDALLASDSDGGQGGYGRGIARFVEMTVRAGETGMAPDAVAAVVNKALTARRPRARYMPGIGNRIGLALMKGMPTRMWDWIVAKRLGLEAKSATAGTPQIEADKGG